MFQGKNLEQFAEQAYALNDELLAHSSNCHGDSEKSTRNNGQEPDTPGSNCSSAKGPRDCGQTSHIFVACTIQYQHGQLTEKWPNPLLVSQCGGQNGSTHSTVRNVTPEFSILTMSGGITFSLKALFNFRYVFGGHAVLVDRAKGKMAKQ